MGEPDEETYERAANNQHLVHQISCFAAFADFRRSDVYRRHEGELKKLLDEPKVYSSPVARPRLKSFLRVVEWNIQWGTRLEGIIDALNRHPVLGYADLLLLNELDDGMGRSANRNVALELGRALSAHAIYGVEYLELTEGRTGGGGPEVANTTALHGVAILTRHEFLSPQVVRLARCENNFESEEKRLGGRIGLLVDLVVAGKTVLAATSHLDVVNTPRCRARQMRGLLEAVEARLKSGAAPPRAGRPVLLGGDLNSHTFARGGRLRSVMNAAIILGGGPRRLTRRLASPREKEPSLVELARFGYEVDSLNDRRPTSRSIVSSLDDASRLPSPVRWLALRRAGPEGLVLELRLDWLAARGVRVLGAGEATDRETGAVSVDPQTVGGLTHRGLPLSDHDPIVVDVML